MDSPRSWKAGFPKPAPKPQRTYTDGFDAALRAVIECMRDNANAVRHQASRARASEFSASSVARAFDQLADEFSRALESTDHG